MTDIVIDNPSKSQTSVKVSNTSLQRFIDELEFIQFFTNPNPIIIALGQKVYSTLAERDNLFERGITFADFVLQNHKKTIGIKSVSHHARKGYRKEDFVEEISKLSRQI
ncbi:MAG: hypothetical protein HY277_02120 [Ignavibacteriales bacterium]|nr:hypothetical protein [Ignavibacteriales bacterium]